MKFFIFSILFMLFLAKQGFAALQIQASLSQNKVAIGQVFKINIKVTSTEETVSVEQPKIPNNPSFDFLGLSESIQSQLNFVNGQQSIMKSKIYGLSYSAKQPGLFKIDGFSIKVNDRVYKTNSLTLTVVKSDQNIQSPNRNQNPFGSLFGGANQFLDMLKKQDQLKEELQKDDIGSINPNEAFFIRANVDTTDVYVGEQVTVSWYIYTRGRILDIDTLRYPSLQGFWKEDIEIATQLRFKDVLVNGEVYQRALLASYALFPISPGTATVDEYKAKCKVINQSQFGRSQAFTYTKSSLPIKVIVKPLPEETKPENFTGAVGQFEVLTEIKEQEIKTNEPFTYEIKFEGLGNAKYIDVPKLKLPETTEVYDVSTETKFFKNGTSFKKITYLIIPKQVGPLVLPSEDVSLFNPVIGEYYTKTIEEKNVNVKKGKDITSFSSSKLDLKKEKVKEETFEMFKNPFGFTFVNQLNSIYIWLVSIFIYFVTILSYLYLTFKEKDEKDSLLETYNLIMDNLKKDIKNKSWKDAGVKATRLIYLVVGTLSNSGQMTSTQIKDSFRALPPSLRKDIEKPLMQHLNFFEEVSFAPADFNETMKNKEKIQKAIKELDKLLIQSINLSFQKNN